MGMPYKSLNEPSAALILDSMKQLSQELQEMDHESLEKHLSSISFIPFKKNDYLKTYLVSKS